MNGLDLLLVVLAILAVVGGWRLGFLTRALGWVGAAAGLAIAVAVVPSLLSGLDLGNDGMVLLLGLACFVVVASLGQAIGAALGSRLRPDVEDKGLRAVDTVGGAVLGLLGVAILAWLVLPVMAQTEGWAAAAARSSALARFTVDHLPSPPAPIQRLERELAGGAFPRLFDGLRRAPELPPPPEGSALDQEALDTLAASTVRIEGDDCGVIQTGSGWVVRDGLVATNAHVVAGNDRVKLSTVDGEEADGVVVAFDPSVDLALIRTSLDRAPLPVAVPSAEDRGVVLGYPGGGPLRPSPFLVGDLIAATGRDIYDRALVNRDLLVLSSDLEPGDSGSAVVREDGTVIGVSVAVAPDRAGVAYALAPDQLAPLLASAARAVSAGPCIR